MTILIGTAINALFILLELVSRLLLKRSYKICIARFIELLIWFLFAYFVTKISESFTFIYSTIVAVTLVKLVFQIKETLIEWEKWSNSGRDKKILYLRVVIESVFKILDTALLDNIQKLFIKISGISLHNNEKD